MKQLIKILSVSALLLGVLSAVSCTAEERKNPETHKANQTSSPTNLPSGNSGIEGSYNKYSKMIGENIKADAIVCNPGLSELPIIRAGVSQQDHSNYLKIFFDNDYKVEEENEFATVYANEQQDEFIVSKDGGFRYRTLRARQIDAIFNAEETAGNGHKFLSDRDLEFLPKDLAVAKCSAFLEDLFIEVMPNPKIYNLDYKTLQEEQQLRMQDETFMGFVESGKIQIKEGAWEEEEEAYCIIFNAKINGIGMDPVGYTIQSADRNINGSQMFMILSKNEIEECEVAGALYSIKEKGANQKLQSFEEAVQFVENKFSNMIVYGTLTITEISLYYVPVPMPEDEYQLIPSWCFTTIEKTQLTNGQETISKKMIRLHAITGKEIV